MQSITFTCEVITPMFLAGADGTTPELRPASIKGALRFWWRAMNGHLVVDEMRKIEGEIFGSTEKRSNIIVICEQKKLEPVNQFKLIAHKGKTSESFKLNETFKITLKIQGNIWFNDSVIFDFEKLKALFEIVCYLGGLGKRSRRGNGCLKITHYEEDNNSKQRYNQLTFGDSLLQNLNLVTLNTNSTENSTYIIDNSNTNVINSNFSNTNQPIPHIITIERIASNLTLEEKRLMISNATHSVIVNEANLKSKTMKTEKGYTTVELHDRFDLDYTRYLGAGKPRFASPIIVSVAPDESIIITTLKTVKLINERPAIIRLNRLDIQADLITEIKNNL
ncbi:type III-B CRISPR module RAMP protein Cmr1 [Flectobacillus major]|uniref:type III-B CRISPR module RAMP protein Cmr1 n=1 Tax=Flectobacillus major TaxID=103 RepID=UPI0003FDB178|nr:type III-B CRISPR module RAMP protein Cmr1 [Flectobacillus major]